MLCKVKLSKHLGLGHLGLVKKHERMDGWTDGLSCWIVCRKFAFIDERIEYKKRECLNVIAKA